MTNDETPIEPTQPADPFEASLSSRLGQAAAGVEGGGVTRSSVDGRISAQAIRRRRARTGIVAGAVAAVVLVAGLAVARAGHDGPSTVVAQDDGTTDGHATTTSLRRPCPTTGTTTSPTTVPPTSATTDAVASTTTAPGRTPFEMWTDALRGAGLLTPAQEAEVAAGRGIAITPEQSAYLTSKGFMGGASSAPTTTSPPAGSDPVLPAPWRLTVAEAERLADLDLLTSDQLDRLAQGKGILSDELTGEQLVHLGDAIAADHLLTDEQVHAIVEYERRIGCDGVSGTTEAPVAPSGANARTTTTAAGPGTDVGPTTTAAAPGPGAEPLVPLSGSFDQPTAYLVVLPAADVTLTADERGTGDHQAVLVRADHDVDPGTDTTGSSCLSQGSSPAVSVEVLHASGMLVLFRDEADAGALLAKKPGAQGPYAVSTDCDVALIA